MIILEMCMASYQIVRSRSAMSSHSSYCSMKICLRLAQMSVVSSIRKHGVHTNADHAYLLSSLLALTQGARAYNLVRPRMTLENCIQIEKGR